MNKSLVVGLSLFFLSIYTSHAQKGTSLAEGEWYKVAVNQSGIYKLDYEFLSQIGIDVENIDPRNITIIGDHGGMLPQPNDVMRPGSLLESSILVIGEDDGLFDQNDLVIFYADGPDVHHYDENNNLIYEQNIYDRNNFYFINIGDHPGRRVDDIASTGNTHPKVTVFDDFKHHELSLTNLLISGRDWYGEKFETTTDYSIPFSVAGINSNSELKITSNVMAQSFVDSKFTVQLNGNLLGEQWVESIPDYNIDFYRYWIKGEETESVFTLPVSQLNDPQELNLRYNYERNNSGRSVGFLDYITVEMKRNLQWYGETTIFRSLESLNNLQSTYEIANSDDQLLVWNITNKNTPINQTYQLEGGKATFGAVSEMLNEYVLFKPSELSLPAFIEKVENQNLRGLSTPELLIISHPDFIIEAQRLASFRASNDNLSTAVVNVNEIYNEFSSGRQDVTAIRDFVKHLYDKGNLKYLLLFGRGSYDYLDVKPNNKNFVPIYESRNSLHPLKTYGSDDYYGLLDDDEGLWSEDGNDGSSLDIGVGRLPLTSLEEARGVVDKLIYYSSDKKSLGKWRDVITFVADDGDGNLHQRQADQLTELVDTTYSIANPNRLFLDNYEQISRPNGEISPSTSEAINQAVDEGALIVNFTGHGGETGWMQEGVLSLQMIREWNNIDKLPLFVTATCEFSRHDDPSFISGGELVVTNPNGGGIGIVSTCRPVEAFSNFELNKAFYNSAFEGQGNNNLRLGDIIRNTKNTPAVNRVGNRNFALLGDPSVRLNHPQQQITLNAIEQSNQLVDTLSALSPIKISGEVLSQNSVIDTDFNGTLYAVVYDKESLQTTLGNENAPFNYFANINAIFRGKVSVIDGKFNFEFIVSKNISYQFDLGKISLYAIDEERNIDAHGVRKVVVGGSNPSPSADTEGPLISLFLGDSTNSSLNDIASNTHLVAKLNDESGINISGYGVGNSLTATLDDSLNYVLNDYYEATNNTYQEGWIKFPLNNLAKGKHTLKLIAWDVFNNSSESTIEFNVLDPNKLSISKMITVPNPFREATTFSFQHNRAGEDLKVELEIINTTGDQIQKYNFDLENSNANVNLLQWNGTNISGEKLRAGLYLYKLKVRSIKDGATHEAHEKLVLIN